MTTRKRGWPGRLLLVLAAVAIAVALLAVVAYWRLSSGAVSLDWFESRIEAALGETVAPASVDLDGASLKWNGLRRPLSVRFAEVQVVEEDGSELTRLEGLSVDLSPRALLRGDVALVRLDIERLRVSLARDPDGSFALRLSRPEEPTESDASPLLAPFFSPPQPGTALGQLTTIGIHRIELLVDDRKLGLAWEADDADLEVSRDAADLEIRLLVTPRLERPVGRLTVDGAYSFESRDLQARIEFDELRVSELSRVTPVMAFLKAIDDPFEGHLDIELSAGLVPERVDFDIRGELLAAEGSVDLSAGLDSATAELKLIESQPWRLAGAGEALAWLDRIRLAPAGSIEVALEAGRLSRATVDLKSGPGRITVPGVSDDPLSLGATAIRGSVVDGLRTIRVDELRTTLGESVVELGLEAERGEAGYLGRLEAGVDHLAVEELSTYWPAGAASAARAWVLERITRGEVRDLRLAAKARVDIGGDPRGPRIEELDGSFDFVDLSVAALAPQPPITELEGNASLTHESLEFQIRSGRLGAVEIGEASVEIGDFGTAQLDLNVELACSTPVAAAIGLLAAEPLSAIDETLISADDVAGSAVADLRVSLPLSGDPRPAPRVSVDSRLSGAAWRGAPMGLEVSQGNLELSFAGTDLRIDGEVAANGVEATVDYRVKLGDEGRQSVEAHARLTPDDLDRLGLPRTPLLDGPLTATVTWAAARGKPTEVSAALDLRETHLSLPFVDWKKPAGVPGTATVAASSGEQGRWSISAVDVEAADLAFEGSAVLEADPVRLSSLAAERLDYAKTRLSGTVAIARDGAYRVVLKGRPFESDNVVRNLLKERVGKDAAGAESSPLPRISLDVALEEVSSHGELLLDSLVATGELGPGGAQSARIKATTRSGDALEAEFGPDDGGRAGQLNAEDVGALLRLLDLTGEFGGGHLDLTARQADPEAPLVMRLDVAGLVMRDPPFLGDIVRAASLQGLLATIEGEGLEFEKIGADLRLDAGKLHVAGGHAHGQGLAITASGAVDFRGDAWDVRGLVAHMGAVQRVIGKIPGVDRILLGRNRGGLLGTEFTLAGPLAEPDVAVEPFSTFTPGMLRDLARFKEPRPTPAKERSQPLE